MSIKVSSDSAYISQYEPYTEEWYNSFEMDEDEVQTPLHILVILYLISVIEQIYKERGQQVTVLNDVPFFQTVPWACPDISVVNGMRPVPGPVAPFIGRAAPPPLVVIEIASENTWEKDLVAKVEIYERLGVPEYFIHDPNQPLLWQNEWANEGRLVGWRLDPASGRYTRIPKVEGNKLWSEELQSWLVIENTSLRLYTGDNELRLSAAETADRAVRLAESARRQAQQATFMAVTERRVSDLERQRTEAERQRAEVAEQKTEAERQRAEAAEREVARLKALLAQLEKPTEQ